MIKLRTIAHMWLVQQIAGAVITILLLALLTFILWHR